MAFDKTRFDIDIAARDLTGPAFGSVNAGIKGVEANAANASGAMGKFQSAAGMMKAALVALPLLAVAQQLLAFHSATVKAVADLEDQADAIDLTTESYQALTFAGVKAGVNAETLSGVWTKFKDTLGKALEGNETAIDSFNKLGIKLLDINGKARDEKEIFQEVAKRLGEVENAATKTAIAKEILGRAGAKLNGVLADIEKGFGGMTDAARAANTVIGAETIKIWGAADDKAEILKLQIRKLYSEFAAPIYMGAIDVFAQTLKGIEVVIANTAATWARFMGALGSGGAGGEGIAKAAAALESLRQSRDRMPAGSLQRETADRAIAAREADLARMQEMAQLAATGPAAGVPTRPGAAQYGGAFTSGITPGVSQVAVVKKGADDKEAYKALASVAVDPFKDTTKAVELQLRIAAATSAALKGVDPNDKARRQQITEAVTALETEKARLDDLKKALADAGMIQRQFGDGQVELAERMRVLDKAFRDNAISADAYAAAVAAAQRQQQGQQDSAARAQGGTAGFAAGFRSAARAAREASDAYSMGAQVYQQGTQIMSDALTHFATTGELSFARVANAFADMLLNMSIKAATNGIFDAIGSLFGIAAGGGGGGGIGGLLSGLFGGGGGGGFASGIVSGGTLFFADGGRPPTSQPSVVGENGPEMWWPDQAGTIYNRAQMAGMGSGAQGGTESPITINLNIATGKSQTIKAELMGLLPHIEARMHASIIDARRRGGSMRSAFAT